MSFWNIYECNCGCCAYWRGDYFNPILAAHPEGHRRVGQCAALGEADRAPFVEGVDGGAFVFTEESASCAAFVPHPELLADQAADDALYAGLAADRAVQAGARM